MVAIENVEGYAGLQTYVGGFGPAENFIHSRAGRSLP